MVSPRPSYAQTRDGSKRLAPCPVGVAAVSHSLCSVPQCRACPREKDLGPHSLDRASRPARGGPVPAPLSPLHVQQTRTRQRERPTPICLMSLPSPLLTSSPSVRVLHARCRFDPQPPLPQQRLQNLCSGHQLAPHLHRRVSSCQWGAVTEPPQLRGAGATAEASRVQNMVLGGVRVY